MSIAKITLIGMLNYDEKLFDFMTLPEGVERDLFIDTLLMKAGEYEVLYSNPSYYKRMIGTWSRKWYRTFTEWLRGTNVTWNPIENYDRYEEWRDTHSKQSASKTEADYSAVRTANLRDEERVNESDTRTVDLRDKKTDQSTDKISYGSSENNHKNLLDKTTYNNNTDISQDSDAKRETKVAAYDAATYRPSEEVTINDGEKSTWQHGHDTVEHTGDDYVVRSGDDTRNVTDTVEESHTGTDRNSKTGNNSVSHTGNDSVRTSGKLSDQSGSESGEDSHTAHIHGNIGVTQASDMLSSFYDIAAWNLYEHMTDLFMEELLICVS